MFGEACLPLKTHLPYCEKVRQCCACVQWALFKLANKLISMVSIKWNTLYIAHCTLLDSYILLPRTLKSSWPSLDVQYHIKQKHKHEKLLLITPH